jgi:hypothetical protein
MSDQLNPEQVKAAEARAAKEGYFRHLLVGLDQFLNVVAGGNPGETMSARSQRAASRGNRFGKFMAWWLGKVQRRHGAKAEAGDLERAEKVEKAEEKDLGVSEP